MKKRLYYKGALFIEYALILAFVIVLGCFFISGDSTKGPIETIFNRASAMLQGKHYIASSKDFWDAVKNHEDNFTFGTSNTEVNGIIDYLLRSNAQFASGAGDVGFPSGEYYRPTIDGETIASAPAAVEKLLEQSGYTGLENVSWSVLDGGGTKYLYVANQRYTKDDFNTAGTFKVTRYDLNQKNVDGIVMDAHLDLSTKISEGKSYTYVVIKPGKK